MDAIIRPLSRGGNSAIVNVFFPCELLQAFGIHPLFAEGLSCYLNGAWAEKYYLRAAEEAGVSPNFCSYHKALLGAGLTGLIPRPDFTACTSLACDANNLTFRRLAQHYDIPCFYVDVPYTRDEDAVREVAVRLRRFADFLADRTGRPLDEDALKAAVARSGRTLDTLHRAHRLLAGKELASDLVSESYEVFLTHILLGTPEAEHYADLLLADAQAAPESNGLRIVWGHTIPFYQAPVKELFDFSDKAHLAACEIGADCYGLTMDPEHRAHRRRCRHRRPPGTGRGAGEGRPAGERPGRQGLHRLRPRLHRRAGRLRRHRDHLPRPGRPSSGPGGAHGGGHRRPGLQGDPPGRDRRRAELCDE